MILIVVYPRVDWRLNQISYLLPLCENYVIISENKIYKNRNKVERGSQQKRAHVTAASRAASIAFLLAICGLT